MKNILIVGSSPLPYENVHSRPAAGLRTWQFYKAILAKPETFNVKLVTIAMPECYDELPSDEKSGDRVNILKSDSKLGAKIQKIHDEFKPDVLLSINTFPSYIASKLKSDAFFWADLNGWVMAEAQAQAYKAETNDYLAHYFTMERSILGKADIFSTVSSAQKYAVLGELAFMGRLNKETFGYKMVHSIPNGTELFENDQMNEKYSSKKLPLLLKKIPAKAFTLLWMGGYNTWVDEVALFQGLEAAMKACPSLYFISTGGEIKSLDGKTFERFKNMIDQSDFRDRFIFLGWLETAHIPYIYKRADAGLNVDRFCAETETGARNRINEMMKFGLPVITTLGSDISYEVVRSGSGLGAESGELSEKILTMYRSWEKGNSKIYGENGKKYIAEKCNYEVLIQPLMDWLESPVKAPDRGLQIHFTKIGYLGAARRYLNENGFRKFFQKLWQKIN